MGLFPTTLLGRLVVWAWPLLKLMVILMPSSRLLMLWCPGPTELYWILPAPVEISDIPNGYDTVCCGERREVVYPNLWWKGKSGHCGNWTHDLTQILKSRMRSVRATPVPRAHLLSTADELASVSRNATIFWSSILFKIQVSSLCSCSSWSMDNFGLRLCRSEVKERCSIHVSSVC